jgi:hypothetical protein
LIRISIDDLEVEAVLVDAMLVEAMLVRLVGCGFAYLFSLPLIPYGTVVFTDNLFNITTSELSSLFNMGSIRQFNQIWKSRQRRFPSYQRFPLGANFAMCYYQRHAFGVLLGWDPKGMR